MNTADRVNPTDEHETEHRSPPVAGCIGDLELLSDVLSAPSMCQSLAWLRTFVMDSSPVHLFCKNVELNGGLKIENWGGFYSGDHLETLIQDAYEFSGHCQSVFFSLNPLSESLLNRCTGQLSPATRNNSIRDYDVASRRWLFIDFDPRRAEGNSSSQRERLLTFDTLKRVVQFLAAKGFPEPIVTDSGNGFHLYYQVELSCSSTLTKHFLQVLAMRFANPHCEIDTTVANPARYTKLNGTLSRKGANEAERPHRYSAPLCIPSYIELLDESTLAAVVQKLTLNEEALRTNGPPVLSEPPPVRFAPTRLEAQAERSAIVERAAAYAREVPEAVTGEGGNKKTYALAARLVHGFGLEVAEAFPLMLEFNSRCRPPWEDHELEAKLRDALSNCDQATRGSMLRETSGSARAQSRTPQPPPLNGPAFPFDVPDFLFIPKSLAEIQLTERQIFPGKGRPPSQIDLIAESLAWLSSQVQLSHRPVIPDTALKLCSYGMRVPKTWQSFLKQQLRRLPVEDLHDHDGESCVGGCLFYGTDSDHEHYRYLLHPVCPRDHAFFRRNNSDDANEVPVFFCGGEESDVQRAELQQENAGWYSYLPVLLFGQAAGLPRRHVRLLTAIVSEMTRPRSNPRRSPNALMKNVVIKNAVVPGKKRFTEVHCPLLNPDQEYAAFCGNLQRSRGSGYRLAKRVRDNTVWGGGWLHKAGYSKDDPLTSDECRRRGHQLIFDLSCLSEVFDLTIVAYTKSGRWVDFHELKELASANFFSAAESLTVRIYTDANFLTKWRRYFCERLGFGFLPGGEWQIREPIEHYAEPRRWTRKRVKQELRDRKLSQKELAERLKVPPHKISRELSDRRDQSQRRSRNHTEFIQRCGAILDES